MRPTVSSCVGMLPCWSGAETGAVAASAREAWAHGLTGSPLALNNLPVRGALVIWRSELLLNLFKQCFIDNPVVAVLVDDILVPDASEIDWVPEQMEQGSATKGKAAGGFASSCGVQFRQGTLLGDLSPRHGGYADKG